MIPSGLAYMSEGFIQTVYSHWIWVNEGRLFASIKHFYMFLKQLKVSSDKYINHKYKQNKTWKEQFTQKNSQKAQVVREAEIRLCANVSLTDTVKIYFQIILASQIFGQIFYSLICIF